MGRIVSQLRTVLKENGQSTELADQVMSTGAGYALIPHLSIDTEVAGLRTPVSYTHLDGGQGLCQRGPPEQLRRGRAGYAGQRSVQVRQGLSLIHILCRHTQDLKIIEYIGFDTGKAGFRRAQTVGFNGKGEDRKSVV